MEALPLEGVRFKTMGTERFAHEDAFALFAIKLTIGKPFTGLIYKTSAF